MCITVFQKGVVPIPDVSVLDLVHNHSESLRLPVLKIKKKKVWYITEVITVTHSMFRRDTEGFLISCVAFMDRNCTFHEK